MIPRFILTAAVLSATIFITPPLPAQDGDRARVKKAVGGGNPNGTNRVLLISIDGMHALDFENCVRTGDCPNLANLAQSGVTYTRASTSKPSDSFPGLTSIVSGASPKLTGTFYDVAYDRALAPPASTTTNGLPGGTCTPGVFPGTTTEYDEGIEMDSSKLNGGNPAASLTEGGVASIDPKKLPRDPANNCAPVYPWNFVRANTIFGVLHGMGQATAWSDKHASYASVSGPTGTSKPSNVDDYYSPEINSNVVALPGVTTPATKNNPNGVSCATIRDNNNGEWTDSFVNVQCYDTLKVNAVVNWVKGMSHNASSFFFPTLFGMNFQAVSVGQKLIEAGVKGGYTDAQGTFTPAMADEIQFVDAGIGEMLKAMKANGTLNSTTIIITAKHGQSPIDTNRAVLFGGNSPATVLSSMLRPSENSPLGFTEDDISLLWLNDSSQTQVAVNMLEAADIGDGLRISEIYYGNSITTMFNAPSASGAGSRTPDIIVQPIFGTIYSGSKAKQAEHGGFAFDDTNVMMLVSNPSISASTITAAVETSQVAPTILEVLGIDADNLDGVLKEGTTVLPGLGFGN